MSAVGTALGPSLGGMLTSTYGWRTVFFINVPLALMAILFVRRSLPGDNPVPAGSRPGLDVPGTVLLACSLGSYALALTMGRGSFGLLNLALLLTAVAGLGLFAFAETRVATPLIRPAMLRNPALRAGLSMGALVAAVMMATLVVGPFYLARTLALDPARVGIVMAVGPLVAALAGIPAGRLADRLGTEYLAPFGLVTMTAASALLAALPTALGVTGYLVPLVGLTLGYALFQTANNTAVMASTTPEERGLVSGALNLSRNLGLITGASVLGALFALATGTNDVAGARPMAVAMGMRVTFAASMILTGLALVVALANKARAERPAVPVVDVPPPG
jgi:MFS family permease